MEAKTTQEPKAKTTIERRGILAHQICYLCVTPDGISNVFKTLRQAQKWATKMDAAVK